LQGIIDTELEILQSQKDIQQKQENIVQAEQEEWTDEYEIFKKTSMFSDFDDIIDSVIEHYGRIRETDINDNPTWWIDKGLLAYATSNELVDLNQDEASISLTKKGKHFVKLFQLDTQK